MTVGDSQKNYCFLFYFEDRRFRKLFFRKLNKDVKLNVYNCMPHGFLNYDSPAQGMAEAKICVQDSIVLLNELLIL